VGGEYCKEEQTLTMGNLPSLWDENRSIPPANREKSHDSVTIKLSCADFGTFNGRSDQWISFKENTLSKAGVGGYAQYFKQGFIISYGNREGNNRIFYLLQTATNGGGDVVRKHASSADGGAAWQSLLAWYEGPVMSGEIDKTLRTKLWALKLQSKGDVNKHINDFTLYMDQLKDLGREEQEETLTDLFLDSVIDPKFEVTVANCRLRDHITIHECFEAIRKYDNIILREGLHGGQQRYKVRCIGDGTKQTNDTHEDTKIDGSYRSYAEWQKLTPEQRSKVLELREKQKLQGNKNTHESEQDTDSNAGGSSNRNRQQRTRKHARRQVSTNTNQSEGDEHQEGEDPL
jgi:hypothetical protein